MRIKYRLCSQPKNAVLAVLAVAVLTPSPAVAQQGKLAGELLARAGIDRGVGVVLGGNHGLALELARRSNLLIHVRTQDAEEATELRQLAEDYGLGIDRLAVEHRRDEQLPYADNIVDLVVVTQASDSALARLPRAELLRVLRPKGVALIGPWSESGAAELTRDALSNWASSAKDAAEVSVDSDGGRLTLKLVAPSLTGAGDWTHWEHGPDNNPVSEDQVIKFPYMTQFMAHPYYIAMPSITTAAAGRTFLAIGHIAHHRREWDMMNKIIARNGYNGTVLWERKLPEGYLVHRSAFIATEKTFYMIDDQGCRMLDPESGREKGTIRIPGVAGAWKWMVLKDDVLYALAGKRTTGVQTTKGDRTFGGWSWADLSKGYYTKPRVPWGFGNTLVAYDLKNEKVLWKHTEDKPIDSRAMSMGDETVYLYCPDHHLRCVDAQTGEVLWTNNQRSILNLIEEPGKGLTSTPGFRSACLAVYTPNALIIQGQTRMNVVAVATSSGSHLWTKKKITNNPNAIFVDGRVILGVGPNGSHVALDPVSGDVLEDLKFPKRACTRLTACSDSFFVRGEGTLRYDREKKRVMIDGSIRPACNDGALPANGLLYLGPWQCDCNLSLIGNVAKCSAGDFDFAVQATEANLTVMTDRLDQVAPFETSEVDWPTYRGNVARSSSSAVELEETARLRWQFTPDNPFTPTTPTAAGDLVFVSGHDGKVRAFDGGSGKLRWEYATSSPLRMPPTIAEGRAYVGCADGHVYALEAATGRELWRFRAAPVERYIMTYGNLSSTWPVNTGVVVQDGNAYFAAGIIDYDGTYVYALDAKSGKIKWQNNSSGHLNQELRKGVSAQGNLTIAGDRLLLAGGNQVSPAPYKLETGECLAKPFAQGQPKANHGQFVGVFRQNHPVIGGRILYSAVENVSSKGSFAMLNEQRAFTLSYGGIPPAWDGQTMAVVNFKEGKLTCCDADKVAERLSKGYPKVPGRPRRFRNSLYAAFQEDGAVRWLTDLGESNKFEAVSLAVCPNAIVAVVRHQQKFRAQPQWFVVAFNINNGRLLWRQEMRSEPVPGGLLIDRRGQVIVTTLSGEILCYGAG